jgi:CheY-like chemotaxis protein
VSNILTNASKYTDNNGSITIKGEQEGSSIVLRVRDNGIGIEPDMLPHIFDLYTQVDSKMARSQGGLGIGLTLVKMLVEMHGGLVTATSDGPGKGSEFTIRLPAGDATSEAPFETIQAEVSIDNPASVTWRRVLVVDDNVDIAKGLAMVIETSGYQVRTATDGRSALAIAREFQPVVVLMDIGLPDMTGYELARAFQKEDERRKAILIAISGFGQQNDRDRSREAGFDHHMVKPVDLDLLLPILAEELGESSRNRDVNEE